MDSNLARAEVLPPAGVLLEPADITALLTLKI